jgi:hypothetical protein
MRQLITVALSAFAQQATAVGPWQCICSSQQDEPCLNACGGGHSAAALLLSCPEMTGTVWLSKGRFHLRQMHIQTVPFSNPLALPVACSALHFHPLGKL